MVAVEVITPALGSLPVRGRWPLPDPLLREGLVPELVCVLDPWLGVPPLPYGLAPAFVPVDPVVPLVLGTG
ncbi:MAG TPA: hypothetical protein VMA77_22400, partial [Solirubrobacteraceae bacterium]|nr:hypothetical protein [Solirubrobacteraceae bacterium]